jgi:hypothetical protein
MLGINYSEYKESNKELSNGLNFIPIKGSHIYEEGLIGFEDKE